jgi:YgiT-type zinc finger domain-containing protein
VLVGLQEEEIITSSDICALCKGKLREGFTELVLKAGAEVLVIKRVPALVCSCCGEAYLTPEVSEKIDQVLKEYRAGRLLARPIAAGEIELEMSA